MLATLAAIQQLRNGLETHSIPRVAIQGLLETFLVQGVADEPNGARQHKEAIQVANLDDLLDLSLQGYNGNLGGRGHVREEGATWDGGYKRDQSGDKYGNQTPW